MYIQFEVLCVNYFDKVYNVVPLILFSVVFNLKKVTFRIPDIMEFFF